LTEPFISGFTTGAALHVFTSQIPSVFGLKTPPRIGGPFKLPRTYVQLVRSLSHINWVSTTIAFVAIIVLYIAKYLNDRYKSIVRVILPCELILVCETIFLLYLLIDSLDNYRYSHIPFYTTSFQIWCCCSRAN
jgi:solute carrier family 26 protein